MLTAFRSIRAGLFVTVLCGTVTAAQQPRIEHGAVAVQNAAGPLAETFRSMMAGQHGPAWIGYTVPADKRERTCSFDSASGVLPSGVVKLEGSDRIVVMYRVENGKVDRIRVFPDDCRVDAGGLPVTWLENVRAAESIQLLGSLAGGEPRDRVSNTAIMAISQHADPSALDALFGMARTGTNPRVRGDALFWLAQRAGDRVSAAIRERIDQDPDSEVKKKAVFALSQLPKDEGVPLLIQVAKTNRNPEVRRQAMFWLGQSRDKRAVEFFAEVLSK